MISNLYAIVIIIIIILLLLLLLLVLFDHRRVVHLVLRDRHYDRVYCSIVYTL
jgi:hypothetical protein